MSHSIRPCQAGDRDAIAAFARTLPERDLLFLGRDLAHPRVIDAWLGATEEGWIDSLVAEDVDAAGERTVIGTAALVRDPLGWSAHVGDVRLLVAPDRRGGGLGRDLLEAVFAMAHAQGLAKLSARIVADHIGPLALFESLGFRAEALLKNHVRSRDGTPHDVAILAYHAA